MTTNVLYDGLVTRADHNHEAVTDTHLRVELHTLENEVNVLKVFRDGDQVLSYTLGFTDMDVWLGKFIGAAWDVPEEKGRGFTETMDAYKAVAYKKQKDALDSLKEVLK